MEGELNIRKIPNTVEVFIDKAIDHAKQICGNYLLSVYLFGGLAHGEFSREVSDVDLLFIIDDTCPDEIKQRLEKNLEELEIRHGFLKGDEENILFSIFASRTALFKSHFILKLRSLKNMDFQTMFEEGKGFDLPLGKILFPLAPSRLVIRNVLTGSKILYGNDIIKTLDLFSPNWTDFNKSLFVSMCMSIFGILFSLIAKSGTRFSLEAFKWYIINSHSFIKGKPSSVKIAEVYIRSKCAYGWIVIDRFSKLRKHYSRDLVFSLISPLYIVCIHSILSKNAKKS